MDESNLHEKGNISNKMKLHAKGRPCGDLVCGRPKVRDLAAGRPTLRDLSEGDPMYKRARAIICQMGGKWTSAVFMKLEREVARQNSMPMDVLVETQCVGDPK